MNENNSRSSKTFKTVMCGMVLAAIVLGSIAIGARLLPAGPKGIACIDLPTPSGNRMLGVDRAYLEYADDMRDGAHYSIVVYVNWRDLSPRTQDRRTFVDNNEIGPGWSIDKTSAGANVSIGGTKKEYWPLTRPSELKWGELKSDIPGWKKYCADRECFSWYFIPPDQARSDIDTIYCAAHPFPTIPRFAGCIETFRTSGFNVTMPIPGKAIWRYREFTTRAISLIQEFFRIGSRQCQKANPTRINK